MSERFRSDRSADPHAAIGAWLLNALPADERLAFEVHVRFCGDCQDEVARLRPVVALLPQLFALNASAAQAVEPASVAVDLDDHDAPPLVVEQVDLEPVAIEIAAAVVVAADLDDHDAAPLLVEQVDLEPEPVEVAAAVVVAADLDDHDAPPLLVERVDLVPEPVEVAAAVVVAADLDDYDASPLLEAVEPQVILDAAVSGVAGKKPDASSLSMTEEEPVTAETVAVKPKRTLPKMQLRRPPTTSVTTTPVAVSQEPFGWTKWASGALCLAAVAAIIWGLLSAQKASDQEAEIAYLAGRAAEAQTSLDTLKAQTSAVTYDLVATTAGMANSTGTIFVSPNNATSVLSVNGMATLPSDSTYQVWYVKPAGEIVPGPLFQVDEQGSAVAQLSSDTFTYTGIALTVEPRSGSQAPTSDVVLQGLIAS